MRPLTHEALMTDMRLLLPSLDGGLHAKKVEPLGGNYTRSNRPIWVLECNNKGQVQAGGVGKGGTNPRQELSDGKTPIGWVIEGKCALALHGGVSQGLLVNTSRNPVNQQFAPLYICLGSEGSCQLRECELNGSGEDVGGIFQLGNKHSRAPDNDQVALWSPPCGGDLDIGVAGGLDKGIVAD